MFVYIVHEKFLLHSNFFLLIYLITTILISQKYKYYHYVNYKKRREIYEANLMHFGIRIAYLLNQNTPMHHALCIKDNFFLEADIGYWFEFILRESLCSFTSFHVISCFLFYFILKWIFYFICFYPEWEYCTSHYCKGREHRQRQVADWLRYWSRFTETGQWIINQIIKKISIRCQ